MPAHRVALLRAGRPSTSQETALLCGVDGTALAEVDQAPPMLATVTLRDARDGGYGRPPSAAVLTRAGELFSSATLAGLTPAEYCELHARATGVPISVARHTLIDIQVTCADMATRVAAERPGGVVERVGAGEVAGTWRRRGELLAVVAPSNNPGTHVQWIQAVAFGYRLAVRPGAQDPFTPARLMAALHQAGVADQYLSLLPGGHATAEALVRAADLSLVFGGDAVADRYADNRRVILRGPGRSKLLQTGELTADALDTICTSISYDGGLRCTNATAVFTDGDPAAVADAIADQLVRLRAAPPQSPSAQLPVQPRAAAERMRAHLAGVLAGAVDVAAARYDDGGLADLGDGSVGMRPAVLVADRADHPGRRIELPFPCVWVLPWQRSDGMAPLRDTLALTILSPDEHLVDLAAQEPSIRKVLHGHLPTFAAGPTSPHDGYLGSELMEIRGLGRGAELASGVAVGA